MSSATKSRKEDQIISYLTLRNLIGMTGALLPVLLPLGCWLLGTSPVFQDSISDYYYTVSGNMLVGILFVLGFFLLAYHGYDSKDDFVANFGFVFALDVALFPCEDIHLLVRIIHFGSAFLLFCIFIWFSLSQFTQSVKYGNKTKSRSQRNTIYIICGWVMIGCLICIGLSYLLLTPMQRADYNTTYIFESLALWAFGLSWLTKGMFLWKEDN